MIYKSVYSSPLGYFEICSDGGESITRLYLTSSPSASYTENALTRLAAVQLEEYFSGDRRTFDLPLDPDGTAFEKEVWRACREIPYGETRTYKEIAAAIGDEKAVRAVGKAIDANPIFICIPCHRVLGKRSFLSGFAADAAIKEALLGAEKNYLKKQS